MQQLARPQSPCDTKREFSKKYTNLHLLEPTSRKKSKRKRDRKYSSTFGIRQEMSVSDPSCHYTIVMQKLLCSSSTLLIPKVLRELIIGWASCSKKWRLRGCWYVRCDGFRSDWKQEGFIVIAEDIEVGGYAKGIREEQLSVPVDVCTDRGGSLGVILEGDWGVFEKEEGMRYERRYDIYSL